MLKKVDVLYTLYKYVSPAFLLHPYAVNSLQHGQVQDWPQLSVLERCLVYRELRYHDTSNIIRKYQANNECDRKVESFSHCTIKFPLQGNIYGLMA